MGEEGIWHIIRSLKDLALNTHTHKHMNGSLLASSQLPI